MDWTCLVLDVSLFLLGGVTQGVGAFLVSVPRPLFFYEGEMDFFGIAAGVKGSALVYFQASRRSGRTTSLLNSVKDGDRVIFRNAREASHFERMAKRKGVNVICSVCSTEQYPEDLLAREYKKARRTIFDHSWLEDFYMSVVDQAAMRIRRVEDALSHDDEEPSAPARLVEMSKWGFGR